MKRILVYSHDTYGLGNIRRMLAICEHLCTVHQDVSILIVTGSPMLHAFRLSARIDYIKLPCLTRTLEGDYEVKSLGLGYEATIRMREQMLVTAVTEFEPDLVLVDKKPFGVNEELRPALDATRSWERQPALVLLLRDILDNPVTTIRIWEKNGYYVAIEDYFDSVLVLGDADVFDLPAEYRFPHPTRSRVEFCGYLGRETDPRNGAGIRRALEIDTTTPLVLVTPGGGEDGANVTDCFRSALASNASPGFASIVVSGPEMPDAAALRLREWALGRHDVHVLDFTNDMAGYIAGSDVVVSMAGYNTVCEILSAPRPAVVIPRVRPVQEQLIRARLLADRGLLRMIHPDRLTPERLLTEIEEALSAGSDSADRLDMPGLERVEKHVAGLLGDG